MRCERPRLPREKPVVVVCVGAFRCRTRPTRWESLRWPHTQLDQLRSLICGRRRDGTFEARRVCPCAVMWELQSTVCPCSSPRKRTRQRTSDDPDSTRGMDGSSALDALPPAGSAAGDTGMSALLAAAGDKGASAAGLEEVGTGDALGRHISTPSNPSGIPSHESLIDTAIAAMARSTASGPRVGAALLAHSGKVYSASALGGGTVGVSGVSLCAERAVLLKALSEGDKEFDVRAHGGGPRLTYMDILTHQMLLPQALYVASDTTGQFLAPCGSCRGLYLTHEESLGSMRVSLPVYMVQATSRQLLKKTVKELLPMAVSLSGMPSERPTGESMSLRVAGHDPKSSTGLRGSMTVSHTRSPHEWGIDQVRRGGHVAVFCTSLSLPHALHAVCVLAFASGAGVAARAFPSTVRTPCLGWPRSAHSHVACLPACFGFPGTNTAFVMLPLTVPCCFLLRRTTLQMFSGLLTPCIAAR